MRMLSLRMGQCESIRYLTSSLPWRHSKTTNTEKAKFETLHFFFCLLFVFFAPACERIVIQTHTALKVEVLYDWKYTVCRRVRASFSQEIWQAGAVKGLTGRSSVTLPRCGWQDVKIRLLTTEQSSWSVKIWILKGSKERLLIIYSLTLICQPDIRGHEDPHHHHLINYDTNTHMWRD